MDNIENKEALAKNLSRYIKRSGKTQKELAAIVGVAPSTFNDWIKGKKYPRIDKIETLANYFGILKSDLIEDTREDIDQMRRTNNTLAKIIVRMRKDEKFMSLVNDLSKLDEEELASIEKVVSAFLK